MQHVTIYTKSWCPYCHSALDLLKKKGVAFEQIDVSAGGEAQAAMAVRANGRSSVPQIFIGESHVGGCDDLYALDSAGKLDPLLNAQGISVHG
jgi:glutaredoxin 3